MTALENIIAAYTAGEKCVAIATEHGISTRSLCHIARLAGLPPRRHGGSNLPPLTAADHASAAGMWSAGVPTAEIARRIGASTTTVRAIAARAGLPPRPQGWPRRSGIV